MSPANGSAALKLTKTPPPPAPGGGQPQELGIDTKQIEQIIGHGGKVNGGVFQVSVPRADKITEAGMEIPPSMGVAIAINFQPTGAGCAAITGDFVLIASEVNPVIRALRGNGIEVTALLLAAALMAGTAAQFVIGERLLVTQRGAHSGLRLLPEHKTIVVLIALLAIAACVLLPLVALAREAGQARRIISAAAQSRTAISNSLWLAAAGATMTTMLGALLGYCRARARMRLRGLADLAMIVIFAVPSTVAGVGLIGLWNRPSLAVYGTQAMVVIAYLARFVPVAALILAASVRQVPVSFEEAAELSGAGWLRIFTRIVLPQIKTGVAATWVVAFIFAFGELGSTILVAPPGESTLPVRIYTLIANAPSSEVAALALMQVCVTLAPLALLGLIAGGKVREGASDA